jgi:hypothetical protein
MSVKHLINNSNGLAPDQIIYGGLSATTISATTINVTSNVVFTGLPSGTTGNTISLDENGFLIITTGATVTNKIETKEMVVEDIIYSPQAEFSDFAKMGRIKSFSQLNINDGNEGSVYFGSTSGVTVDVLNSRIGIGTQTPTKELDIIGNAQISGSLSATTISGGAFYGDGSGLTGVGGGGETFTGGTVTGTTFFTDGVSGTTVSGGTFYGDGSNLTGINVYTYPTYKTGNTITFDSQYFYNSRTTPGTGNVTEDLTGAQLGVVQKIYHNDIILPSFPAGWILIGSGTYTIGVLNIIMCEWIGGSSTEYWILQDQ